MHARDISRYKMASNVQISRVCKH